MLKQRSPWSSGLMKSFGFFSLMKNSHFHKGRNDPHLILSGYSLINASTLRLFHLFVWWGGVGMFNNTLIPEAHPQTQNEAMSEGKSLSVFPSISPNTLLKTLSRTAIERNTCTHNLLLSRKPHLLCCTHGRDPTPPMSITYENTSPLFCKIVHPTLTKPLPLHQSALSHQHTHCAFCQRWSTKAGGNNLWSAGQRRTSVKIFRLTDLHR